MIAAKKNHLPLVKLFLDSLRGQYEAKLTVLTISQGERLASNTVWLNIVHASYVACLSGHLPIVKYLFESANLFAEYVSTDLPTFQNANSDLNAIHVAAFKANIHMLEYLLSTKFKGSNSSFLNKVFYRKNFFEF